MLGKLKPGMKPGRWTRTVTTLSKFLGVYLTVEHPDIWLNILSVHSRVFLSNTALRSPGAVSLSETGGSLWRRGLSACHHAYQPNGIQVRCDGMLAMAALGKWGQGFKA